MKKPLPLLVFALLLSGCASSATVPAWQKDVERYVRDSGDDPSVLRTVQVDGRRGYALLGSADPSRSTDVKGVLLGHQRVGERSWFVYLVGLVKRQKVSEVRLAALDARGGSFRWALGSPDRHATQKYLDFQVRQASTRFASRPPAQYKAFPQPDDQFDLALDDARATATHRASGAAWTLDLPER